MAGAILSGRARILAANAKDLEEAKAAGATPAFIDRLALDEQRVKGIADSLDLVRELPDPVRAEMEFIFAETIEDVLRAALPHTAEPFLLVA